MEITLRFDKRNFVDCCVLGKRRFQGLAWKQLLDRVILSGWTADYPIQTASWGEKSGNKKPAEYSAGSILNRSFCLLMINLIHMLDQHQNLVAVTPFVVIPRNQFDKMVVEHDAGLFIKN